MGLFSSLFKSKKYETELFDEIVAKEESPNKVPIKKSDEINYEFPEDEIVKISDDELDTDKPLNIAKLKHNLKVLIARTKKSKRVDKFLIIREDDAFPYSWKWIPCSYFTRLEYESTSLSYHIRKRIAENRLNKGKINSIKIPHTTDDINNELKKIDIQLGNIYMPSHFRSTKHFTINTPLGVTGDHNTVLPDKNFIVIDTMDNFLNSGYAYTVGYKDSFLDVTHEHLDISEDAVILIRKERYDTLTKDPLIKEQLSNRKVIKFTGDEIVAIDMVLTELGALPYRIGHDYAFYDKEIEDILESSIKDLARKNNLTLNQNHGAALVNGGHFSNYYDEKNYDYNKYLERFASFIREKYPETNFELIHMPRVDYESINELIDALGPDKLLDAINEYNKQVKKEFIRLRNDYLEDRKQITEDIHNLFISTIGLIENYYNQSERISENAHLEDNIKVFLQSRFVLEQVESARVIQKMLNRNLDTKEDTQDKNKLL